MNVPGFAGNTCYGGQYSEIFLLKLNQ